MGWSMASNTDFSGYQLEIALYLTIVFMFAVWVFFNSDYHFRGLLRHFFWLLTIVLGPVGLFIYLCARRLELRRNG
ncbi:hypothetical protein V1499_10975 [Neobacillus sp. SCS-31]|uniref:hypothetical protein n=1 Tax=Neobacillus oceani TaxID=3115292 RepID=UPI0039061064